MKDKQGNIHIFEVKGLNKSGNTAFDAEEYEAKIGKLKECYKEASAKLRNHIFYIPVKDGDNWQIFKYENGEESELTKQMFKHSFE